MSVRGVKIERSGNLITIDKEPIPELWTIEQLCALLNTSKDWVYRRTMKDAPDPIPHIKLGHVLRFVPGDIYAWLRSKST
ncbi:MAG: helix-turn-helix domain-containing protein [Candidatus Aquicultor sp.]|nr:helix-turn-helix domain-containing protein [Candidatus Aquicultor sp.]